MIIVLRTPHDDPNPLRIDYSSGWPGVLKYRHQSGTLTASQYRMIKCMGGRIETDSRPKIVAALGLDDDDPSVVEISGTTTCRLRKLMKEHDMGALDIIGLLRTSTGKAYSAQTVRNWTAQGQKKSRHPPPEIVALLECLLREK